MSVKTKKIRTPEGTDVRAVKLSFKNAPVTSDWCDGEHVTKHLKDESVKVSVRVKTKKGIRVALAGDWIAKRSKDDFFVIKAASVGEEYALV